MMVLSSPAGAILKKLNDRFDPSFYAKTATFPHIIHQTKLWTWMLLMSWLGSLLTLSAQNLPPTICSPRGAPYPSALRPNASAKTAAQTRFSKSALTYIPLRAHIFRRSNGSGGLSISVLNEALAATNRHFLTYDTGIQFYLAGTAPHYIDQDDLYNGITDITSAMDTSDVANALNLYFYTSPLTNASYMGYAYYPGDSKLHTRSVYSLSESFVSGRYLGERLMAHELGHSFNLIHTFGGSNEGTDELVTRGAGANCSFTGDLVCDTPADPYQYPGGNIRQYDENNCAYYTGTIRDANGDLYAPDVTNVMSYYNASPHLHCPYRYTPGQVSRLQEGAAIRQGFTTVTLDYPPTGELTSPELTATTTVGGNVLLSWVDRATSAIGYLIERSTAPTSGFLPITGVGPDQPSWIDATAAPQTTYYYRIRASNTTIGAISPVVSVTTGVQPCRPTYVFGCDTGVGLASFSVGGTPLSHQSRCSPQGYGEFSLTTKPVQIGQLYAFRADLLTSYQSVSLSVFLDKNRNDLYESNELLTTVPPTQGGTLAGAFSIPADLTEGSVGLRVMVNLFQTVSTGCGDLFWGETQDYRLQASLQPPCSSMWTVKSGSWNDPSIWSCGRLPTELDDVTIQADHKVLLDSTMAEAVCRNVEIIGTFSMQGSSITIGGNRVVIDESNVVTK